MSTNPYWRHPLYIAEVDPDTGKLTKSYVFLGGVPKQILEAARRGSRGAETKNVCKPVWNASDSAVLAAFYGSNWRNLLTPQDPPEQTKDQRLNATFNLSFFGGGAEGGRPDLSELDWLDKDTPVDSQTYELYPNKVTRTSRGRSPPIYSDIAVYPEDTIFDLRLKLCAASDIPIWRVHLFYYISLGEAANSLEGPIIPYKISLDSLPININWRDLAQSGAGNHTTGPSVADVSVDPLMEERRDSLKIEALDTFTKCRPDASLVRVTRLYYVDLDKAIHRAPPSVLGAALRDRYQFDLLYYGAIIKYWPLLSPDACLRALTDPKAFAAAYPDLALDPESLRERFRLERKLADASLSWQPPVEGRRAPIAVTSASLRVMPAGAVMRIAIRNVFDWVPTDGIVQALDCALT